ncbi:MAG: four helix bundle protein [Bradymonadaceae bacterium]
MSDVRNHEDLKAFTLADDLTALTYRITENFPQRETFGLAAQIRKSAVSVPSNIVEGCARSSEPEFIRHLEIAYGSAKELQYQVSLAHRLGYIGDDEYREFEDHCDETLRVLVGLIQALRD